MYKTGSQIKLKTLVIKLRLCDYSDAYILVYRTVIPPNTATKAALNYKNKKIVFENCPQLTDCTRVINKK